MTASASFRSRIEDVAYNAISAERGSQHMLALGQYRFSIETATYQKFSREFSFLWPTQQRFGEWAAPQFVGRGEYKRTLNGIIYPEFKGGFGQIEAMAKEASLGTPLQLVSGTGDVLGLWCITSIKEDTSHFSRNGQPRKIEFSLGLMFYGERHAL